MLNGRHLKYQAIWKTFCAFSNVHNILQNQQGSACGLDLLLSMVSCTTLVHAFLSSPAYKFNSRVSLLFLFLQITLLLFKGSLPLSTGIYRRGK